ncbi:MAG TPA: PAS domain S-box protein [Candidatus Angelobacter sp.]|nr:PAS domain S-box protein [Candidatus Angelobacter sp.]
MKFFAPEISHTITVRGTEIHPDDTPQEYLQKLARITLDEMGQFVGILTTKGILLECNRAALESGGLTRDDVIGKPFWETFWCTVTPTMQQEVRKAIHRAAQGEHVCYDVELFARKGSKETTAMDFTLAPVKDESGQIVFLLLEGRDITDKKVQEREIARERHELAHPEKTKVQPYDISDFRAPLQSRIKPLEEAQRLLAAIVESSDDAIASKDLNGIVTSWNRSAERLLGYSADEMIGQPITLIIPPELHPDETMILGKIRRGEKIDHFETVRVRKDGERIEVSLTISPVRDKNGIIIGAAKIIRDITESKKIERALRTTEKLAAAGRLAATVAHEINNPLEAVTNLVYLAKRDLSDRKKVEHYLQLASRELDRVSHIARQTLGFYRENSQPTAVNISQILNDLLFLYETRLQSRKIKVVKQYDKPIEITALAGEIRQAFSNLITNAIDAMPSGGTLLVRATESHAWSNSCQPGVRITILDTGSGIKPQHKNHLFQPFFTTKADVGTGLGLWITRTIIVKHHGQIRIKSRSGSKVHGTAFSIFLPLQTEVLKSEPEDKTDTPSAISTGVMNA